MFKASNGISYPDGSAEVDVHDHYYMRTYYCDKEEFLHDS